MTDKKRIFAKENRYMMNLSGRERKIYEECLALLQGINGVEELEEACELLERYVKSKGKKKEE